jgi:hypothetical protein
MAREFMTRHHLTPRERGGKNRPSNLCRLWWTKHFSLHKLFKNRTLDEILAQLRFQVQQCVSTAMSPDTIPVRCNGHAVHWENVFGDRSVPEAIEVLARLKRFKESHVEREVAHVDKSISLGKRSRKRKRNRTNPRLRNFNVQRGGH